MKFYRCRYFEESLFLVKDQIVYCSHILEYFDPITNTENTVSYWAKTVWDPAVIESGIPTDEGYVWYEVTI